MTEILLCCLKLYHLFCLIKCAEEWRERLAWLEIDRSILDLNDHIIVKLSIKRLELLICLLCAVRVVGCIDKRTPHDNASVRLKSARQHVGTFRVRTSIIVRARLSLAVGFHKETSEVRHERIDFVALILPPVLNSWVERISSIEKRRVGRSHTIANVRLRHW